MCNWTFTIILEYVCIEVSVYGKSSINLLLRIAHFDNKITVTSFIFYPLQRNRVLYNKVNPSHNNYLTHITHIERNTSTFHVHHHQRENKAQQNVASCIILLAVVYSVPSNSQEQFFLNILTFYGNKCVITYMLLVHRWQVVTLADNPYCARDEK